MKSDSRPDVGAGGMPRAEGWDLPPAPQGESEDPEWRPHAKPSVRVIRPEEPDQPATRRLREETHASEPPTGVVEQSPPEAPFARVPRVLGVNIVGGAAYLALLEAPNRPLLDLAEVLVPSPTLETGAQLAEFSTLVNRTLRDLRVSTVAIARPLRYTNWRYADALERASLETCIMLEANRRAVRFESVGQHHAANVVGLPLERVDDVLRVKLRADRTARWPERAPAALVALAVVLGNRE